MKNNQPFITTELIEEWENYLVDLIHKRDFTPDDAITTVANWWLQKMSDQKERLIKEVEKLDVSTMTYGAFRRKVLEILK